MCCQSLQASKVYCCRVYGFTRVLESWISGFTVWGPGVWVLNVRLRIRCRDWEALNLMRCCESKGSLPLLVQGIRGLGLNKSIWGFGDCRPGFSAALGAPQVTLRDRTRFSCYSGGMDVV